MKRIIQHCFLCIIILIISCQSNVEHQNKKDKWIAQAASLNNIIKSNKIRALVDNSNTSYFVFKGQAMGFEFELLNAFANHLDVELEIEVIENLDSIFNRFDAKEADIIAANLTVTKERRKAVLFSNAIIQSRQVLVQHLERGRKIVRKLSALIDSTVHVRRNSSFYERLTHLSEEIGGNINIETVPGTTPVEKLIEKVNQGDIHYTIADEHIAKINKAYFRKIDIKTPISLEQQVAWALPLGSDELRDTLNKWLESYSKTIAFRMTYLKYFGNTKIFRNRLNSELFTPKSGQISPYDEVIKSHIHQLGWDWLLVVSLIYQESGFDHYKEAWTGASGLMQLMPNTAESFGLDSNSGPEENIRAGINYLKWLDTQFEVKVEDSLDRIPFVLAAYNVGLGHVFDAIRLAEKFGFDPKKWDNNVEEMILKKSEPEYYKDEVVYYGYCRGSETFKYVREVFDRYQHYVNIIQLGDH